MLSQDSNLIQTIVAAVGTQPGIRPAILFGSLAADEGRVESDLDLAVDAGRSLTADEKMALIAEWIDQRWEMPLLA